MFPGNVKGELSLKGWAASRDEMIARLRMTLPAQLVGIARIFVRIAGLLLNAAHDTFCNFNFRVFRSTREILDGVAVVISCRKIHVGKVGVIAENFVYKADAFKEYLPVECGNQAHAGNDVAYGHAHGPLFLELGADNFIGGCS